MVSPTFREKKSTNEYWMDSMEATKAYKEGAEASFRSFPLHCCPYMEGVLEYSEWREGWQWHNSLQMSPEDAAIYHGDIDGDFNY